MRWPPENHGRLVHMATNGQSKVDELNRPLHIDPKPVQVGRSEQPIDFSHITWPSGHRNVQLEPLTAIPHVCRPCGVNTSVVETFNVKAPASFDFELSKDALVGVGIKVQRSN